MAWSSALGLAPALHPSATCLAAPLATATTTEHKVEDSAHGLSDEEIATLSSLKKLDEYPLYTMHYYGSYTQRTSSNAGVSWLANAKCTNPSTGTLYPKWGCSLFAALGDTHNMHYARNFDWYYSPAVLLFTQPPNGYASVSMVDIAYLGFGGASAGMLTDLPNIKRLSLLYTPRMPFDGMNEHGLAVGMAAVPPGDVRPDPNKQTISSLMVIRKILDNAKNVSEAIEILKSYNIDMRGGPPIHYLIADPSGHSELVEFYRGQMVTIPNKRPWHLATNFLCASIDKAAEGTCWRYDIIKLLLTEAKGRITADEAMKLLAEVSQGSTQWSIIYKMSTKELKVTMGRQYDRFHNFHLSSSGK